MLSPSESERFKLPLLQLRRRPLSYWVLATAMAVITGLVVFSQLGALRAERERLGTTTLVPVAVSPLAIGAVVDAETVVYESRPQAFVPAAGIATTVEGRTVTAPVTAGEIIMEQRLAGGSDRPLTALAPADHRILALPVGDAALPLLPGDKVEIVRTTDVFGVDAEASSIGVGTIVETSDARVSIGVPAALVGQVVAGVHTGTLELALIRPGDDASG